MKNEENIDEQKINEQKILKAFKSKLKVHIILKGRSWRNGFVKEIHPDFFIFKDIENDEEAFFFLEVYNVEPYMEEIK
jgi:hypothetical protein